MSDGYLASWREREERRRTDPAFAAACAVEDAVRLEEERALLATREAERAARRREQRLRDTGAPGRAVDVVLRGAEPWPAVERVLQFLCSRSASILVLAGAPRAGKSVAAVVALDATAGTGLFLRAVELARADSYGAAVADLWEPAERTGLLVVDDLGQESLDQSGRALGNLLALLCGRYDDGLHTIVTTNLARAAWTKRYLTADGGRLAGRMEEGGAIWETRGPSLPRAPEGGSP